MSKAENKNSFRVDLFDAFIHGRHSLEIYLLIKSNSNLIWVLPAIVL